MWDPEMTSYMYIEYHASMPKPGYTLSGTPYNKLIGIFHRDGRRGTLQLLAM